MSSASGNTEPDTKKAKKPKAVKAAQLEAGTAMHAELRSMGYSTLADFHKVEWVKFKDDNPEVSVRIKVALA